MNSLGTGERNENPCGLVDVLFEDYAVNGVTPGFVAIAVNRIGNARMDLPKYVRPFASVVYNVAQKLVIAAFGIDLPYNIKIGRRLKIQGHGCLMVGAHRIGNDVTFRGSATVGVRERGGQEFPVIGHGVTINHGAAILGNVTVEDHAWVGPNTVVCRNVKRHQRVLGLRQEKFVEPSKYMTVAGLRQQLALEASRIRLVK